ncbi:MAG: hypothetical protein PVF80_07465 [Gammaproteobacteria bacterium]|jgi:hypothetical protein
MKTRNLILFHIFPPATIVFPFVWVGLVGNDHALKGEAGFVELTTVLWLVIAIGFCISAMRIAGRLEIRGWLRAWLIIMILGSLYFGLEELSYGQHIFGWKAGETMSKLNDQQETNLHNISAVFDQLPRTLLELGILVGGIVMPLVRHFRNTRLEPSNRLYWQWPTMDCVTVGLLVILLRPVLNVFETDIINTGETKENLMAMFIMLYCISMWFRLRKLQGPNTAAAESSSA